MDYVHRVCSNTCYYKKTLTHGSNTACSIFTELMTRQANVKTIAVGGRPQIAPSKLEYVNIIKL
jgi:hypothetical protein